MAKSTCFAAIVGHYDGISWQYGIIPRLADNKNGGGWLGGWSMMSPGCVRRTRATDPDQGGRGVAEKRAGSREKGRIYATHPPLALEGLGACQPGDLKKASA